MDTREAYIKSALVMIRKWPSDKLDRMYKAQQIAVDANPHDDHTVWRLEAIEKEVQRRNKQHRSTFYGYKSKPD